MSAKDLDYDMLHRAAILMEREGGSFAACIAEAYYCADKENRARLLGAFGHIFERFAPTEPTQPAQPAQGE